MNLRCPYCGGVLVGLVESDPHGGLFSQQFAGTVCNNSDCLAEWDYQGNVVREAQPQ